MFLYREPRPTNLPIDDRSGYEFYEEYASQYDQFDHLDPLYSPMEDPTPITLEISTGDIPLFWSEKTPITDEFELADLIGNANLNLTGDVTRLADRGKSLLVNENLILPFFQNPSPWEWKYTPLDIPLDRRLDFLWFDESLPTYVFPRSTTFIFSEAPELTEAWDEQLPNWNSVTRMEADEWEGSLDGLTELTITPTVHQSETAENLIKWTTRLWFAFSMLNTRRLLQDYPLTDSLYATWHEMDINESTTLLEFGLDKSFNKTPGWRQFLTNIYPNLTSTLKTTDFGEREEGLSDRFRFKPGYIRLWKRSRRELEMWWRISFPYTHRLTRLVLRLQRYRYSLAHDFTHRTIVEMVQYAIHITQASTVIEFLNCDLIYVNGWPCANPHFRPMYQDFIQFPNSLLWYYWLPSTLNDSFIHTASMLILFQTEARRIRLTVQPRARRIRDLLMVFKQFSGSSWFLEEDYLTMTFWLIWSHEREEKMPRPVQSPSWGMYNWKYIT